MTIAGRGAFGRVVGISALALLVTVALGGCDTTVSGSRLLVISSDGTIVVPLSCSADADDCRGTIVVRVDGVDGPPQPYEIPAGGEVGVDASLTADQLSEVPDTAWVEAEVFVDQVAPRQARMGAQQVWVRRAGGSTVRVSVASDGTPSNRQAGGPAVSGDGRFVVFETHASNLVPDDTNGVSDVFLFDAVTRTTTRLSVGPGGVQGNGRSSHPSISRDGRVVAFTSWATNLVPDDTNGAIYDAYVLDRATGTMTRVPFAGSSRLAISGDGHHLGFSSGRSDLVPGDTNGRSDVFVHDLVGGTTTRASVASSGAESNGSAAFEGISDDGTVVFWSSSDDLVPGDTNGETDVFVHDPHTGTTTRVSVPDGGGQANAGSLSAGISGDGRSVAFSSLADNLVPDDTNADYDAFVHDRVTASTRRVSVTSDGDQGTPSPSEYRRTGEPSMSADGRYVAFLSSHRDLVPGPVTFFVGIYVHDLATGTTTLATVTSEGVMTDGYDDASEPHMAADGTAVAFTSDHPLAPGESPTRTHVWLRSFPG